MVNIEGTGVKGHHYAWYIEGTGVKDYCSMVTGKTQRGQGLKVTFTHGTQRGDRDRSLLHRAHREGSYKKEA